MMPELAKEQDCTILLVTPDSRILDIADHIIYMEDGCLTENNTQTTTQ
jgi:putative ABC transport system ATP-binding protein